MATAPTTPNDDFNPGNDFNHDLIPLFEHDLFGKPVSTFPDYALVSGFPRNSEDGI